MTSEKNMEDLNLPNVISIDEAYGRFGTDDDGDRDASSSLSVASSAYTFRMEHGRRYHDYKIGSPFPHDEVSDENDFLLHELCLVLLDDRYYLAPIDETSLHCVVDVGTGLGLWAEGVAERFPDSQVVGIDLTPHPRSIFPNCSYMLSDASEEWVLDDPTMKFDLAHIRSLFGSVPDWAALYKNCFDNMNSGGWIEHLEMEINAQTDDAEVPADSQIKFLSSFAHTHMTVASGRDFGISFGMRKLIEEAGFVDVQEKRLKVPLGPWASDPKLKEVGRLCERFYKTGLQGWLMHVCTRSLGGNCYRTKTLSITIISYPSMTSDYAPASRR
ncbi:hypothetical protein LTS07_004902 [Exophiala sideris]|uniref:Methyltransferase domain-containing protein n=1 Tax=Exophiala sideris TaxID=1016849 RepID=A0ABR0JC36_9EURO|nr:hypothetical protein LTS07_004902 [Exophiala sideris]KAK5038888.1 hypothetical protein LTR13_003919 [Exophiala sideris]KAK5060772.1 hypothetical protein LTR69_005371 [Exophiala sideris]KAK5183684.1 hypothetical protein LTR44_003966 [Eurotiomycetes sp. CCFEE 6388]